MDLQQYGYYVDEHAPVSDELSIEPLAITGEIPAEFGGMYVRNSPNPHFPPQGRYHWFDGDGMVHGLQVQDGRARYLNRYIHTEAFQAEAEVGGPLWTGIMEPMNLRNPRGPLKDTANTDLVTHQGRLYALWWLCGSPYRLNPTDLSTLGIETFGGTFPATGADTPSEVAAAPKRMSAHAKVDPRTGQLVFFSYDLFRKPYMHYGVVSKDSTLVHYIPISTPAPHIQHDMALTENYSILLDMPLGWDPHKLAQGKIRLGFDRETPLRFGVIPRLGNPNQIRWFETESAYVYHTINAWEEGDEIVLTACRVQDPTDRPPPGGRVLPQLEFLQLEPFLYRWRLNLVTGAVKGEQLDDVPTEFPKTNDHFTGVPSRFSYNPRMAPDPALKFDGLIKYDIRSGKRLSTFNAPPHWFHGEADYAPRLGSTALGSDDEDDGFVVTFATSARENASEYWILSAKDLSLGPLARIHLPRRIPLGFHSTWVPLG